MALRIRVVALACGLLLVAPSVPVAAQETDAAAVESADPVVVPEVADRVVVPPRLSAQAHDPLPDPDVGRDGFLSGRATVVAGADGAADLGGLPVSVTVDAAPEVEGAAEGDAAVAPGVSVGVVVAEPLWASLVSPEVGLAVQVDLFVDGNTAESLGARSATVTLDYSEVPLGYGAGTFERLTVFWVDDCGALPTGELVCETRVPVETQRLTRDRTLTFRVSDADLRDLEGSTEAGAAALPAGLSGAPVRLWGWGGFGPPPGGWFVVGSTPDGPQGSFSASPQSVIADYQVGVSTGFFEMSYPIGLPPAFAGPQPSVVLSYSSGSVNGLTMDRNTQASVIGLGWSYHPGSITRMLAPCDAVSGGAPGSGDLCPTPDEEIFTLNLNGMGSKLVEVDATNRIFRLEGEQFWEVQLYTGASNGDSEGEYWVLRTPDGYSYQFGREQTASYNSLQFVRVWVPSGGNPGAWCGGSTSTYCNKGYQWNLEKVTDPDGYVMEVFYSEELNEYDSNGTDISYIRDALPDYIVYGDGPTTEHHAKVDFVYDDRCFETTCVAGDAQDFPDTPVDLDCSTGDCTIDAPSFWTSQRLASIDVYGRDLTASGDPYVLLDRYELTQDFPTIPDDPDGDEGLTRLWLVGIQRLAVSEWYDDPDEVPYEPAAVDLPATTFDFVLLPNRMTYLDWEWYQDAPLYMPRISQVTNELGGVTTIEYGRSHDCYLKTDSYDTFVDDWPLGSDTLNDASTPGSTFRRRQCDEFLAKDPSQTSKWVPMRNWKVIRITEEGDHGNPDVVTTYDYRLDDGEGDPTSWPLWKWREDPFGGVSVWNDYRGHRRVKVIDSSGAYRIHTFYAGVTGDHEHTQNAVLSLTETFTTSDSVTHTDYEYLRGQTAEVAAYDASGSMLTRTVTDYYAAETFTGKGTWFVRPAEVTETVFGSPNVTVSTEYSYDDDHGNPTLVLHDGTAGDGPLLEEVDWAQSDNYPLMWLPRRRTLWAGTTPGDREDAQAVVEYLYDGATSVGTDPTHGRLTKTRYYTVRGVTSAGDDYVAYSIGYDPTSHRPTTYTDPEGTVTGFGYDSEYGYVVSKTLDQGGFLALSTGFTVHPARGVLLSSTDPNEQSDRYQYDELGRLVGYWNRTRDQESTASILYSYTNAGGGTPAVTRQRPLVGGNRLDSYTYSDGFGRVIQTQTPFDQDGDAVADDRAVVSTQYNTRGLVEYQSAAWVNMTGAAGAGFLSTTWSTTDSYTRSIYDALGRVTAVDAMSDGVELFDTETAYSTAANRLATTTTDAEGRWVTHYSDGFGRLVRVSEPGDIDTFYTYTARGELATVTDDASNVTTIEYDILGRKIGMVDPDMGTWAYEYYDSSLLHYQTDARGTTLTFVYDDLGRLAQRKEGSTVLAEWFYGTGEPDTNNLVGRLVKSRINGNDTDAVVEYDAYDPDGNLLSQDLIIAGTTYEADFTYYNGGAVEDLVYPLVPGAGSRETVTVTFDGLGHPYDLIGGQIYVDSASWTAAGQPSIWAFSAAADITRRWDYDPATLRPTQLKAGTSQISGTSTVNLIRLEYSYDDSGNVTRILDYRNSSQYECYGYDTHNRLTDAFTGNSTCTSYSSTGSAPFDHDYAYDNLHNLTSLDGPTYTHGSGNTSADGDAGPHAVTEIGTAIEFGYDDNGNRITKTDNAVTTTYTYSPENRLAAVDLPSDNDDVVFVYDADGRRVSRGHGIYTTAFVAGLMEIDRTGSTVTETRTHYTFAGTPVAVRTHTTAATVFLFQNHLGSTVAAFDDTSNSHIKQYYYPYGAERHAVGTLPVDQRYTGQTSDATGANSGDTGLYYYNARYYDPQVGAFAAADTIVPTTGLSVGLNRYGYVDGNPANLIDPTGHAVFMAFGEQQHLGAGWRTAVLNRTPFGLAELAKGSGWGISVHGILDVAGAFPVVGEVADAVNAAIYAWEGDWVNAGISAASVFGGDALKGLRYGDEAVAAIHSGDEVVAAATHADDGLIYLRTNDVTGAHYVGQTISPERFVARQREHALANPTATYSYEILESGVPRTNLDVFEETWIRELGGPTNRTNPIGGLENRRHQMSNARYQEALELG